MNDELKSIIQASTFEVIEGAFVYGKVKSLPLRKNFFMVAQDADEITVVAEENYLGDLELVERNKDNYALVALNVSVPFYAVGLLATVSKRIAEERMNVLIVSTFSKDYIMVKQDCVRRAEDVLLALGFKRKRRT